MKYDFDKVIERKGTDSLKWMKYGDDVIPLWVADMDFPSAEPIVQALHHRIDHRIYGYTRAPQALRHAISQRLKTLYGWAIEDEEIIFLPGLVVGLNLATQVFSAAGEGVLVQPPVYHQFIRDPIHHGRVLDDHLLFRRETVTKSIFPLLRRPSRITPESFSSAILTIPSVAFSGEQNCRGWQRSASVETSSSAQTKFTAISSIRDIATSRWPP